MSHFHKSGKPVSRRASEANWEKLLCLLIEFSPRQVFFLGDLFQSIYNLEWEELAEIIQHFQQTEFHLIRGNHDILDEGKYRSSGLIVYPEKWEIGPFRLTYHPEDNRADLYNQAGQVHPGD